MAERVDIAVVGAGAGGLFAAIWAGRTRPGARVVAFDGAKRLGAKILVAGGGRCNVTHHAVDEGQYAGSSRHAIRKVLGRFDVARTVEFFRALGVELKREETGKLFPVTDDAHTVLDAMLGATREAGVELRHPARVTAVERLTDGEGVGGGGGFRVVYEGGEVEAGRVVLATGGMALPRTGSDGVGYGFARGLGHTVTARVFPALVPLTLPREHWVCGLSGLAVPATVEVRAGTGKRLAQFTNALLCTHFGVSGPAALDVSRYYRDALDGDAGATLVVNWVPGETVESVDAALMGLGRTSPARWLGERVPERLARAVCASVGVGEGGSVREGQPSQGSPASGGRELTRERRRALAVAIAACPLPVTGDRGFTYAEVTAGGVPLAEVRLETMESRVCPGLHLCGEVCDVDGRIGGFNFQWAWASGYVAGVGAASRE